LLLCCISIGYASASLVIEVDAGEPTTICFGETLDIEELGASISGDVSDGLWFTQGDGIFLPGSENNGIFSTTTHYQPGLQDIQNGSFSLILVSDDPDGNGPMVEVSDMVTVTFMNAPALVCNNSINVSLAEGCEQVVDIFMVLANPSAPYDKYEIELVDENGMIIVDNNLTVDHIDQEITFTVGHGCTSNSCGGNIIVSDNIAPFVNCLDVTVDCENGTNPENAGFPIPFYATATSTGSQSYSVSDFDACGEVTLVYQDLNQEMNCAGTGYIMEITRSWVATDESGNSSNCEQTIMVNPLPLSAVEMPANYDGSENAPLICDGNWTALDNGYPSPSSTGTPSFPDCGNIEATYTDVYFEECGAGFKVVRQWFVIDWCTTNSLNHNQIIKILDQEGPTFSCPEDMTISTEGYDCVSEAITLSSDLEVVDCSDEYSFSYEVYNEVGEDLTIDHIDDDVLSGLPQGMYQLAYIVTDICGNSSSCNIQIAVEDNAAPFAVCDGFTKVAVTSNGVADLFASSLDDDSFDNCGEITMEVAKMTDECGWGLSFGPKVHFCCDEIGDTVLVAFKVTDQVGLSNTCMVSVLIEDKLPPEMVCPSDITLSCDVAIDINDLSDFGIVAEGESSPGPIILDGAVIGQSGYYNDNCSVTISEVINDNVECGNGTITRTFTATDAYGESNSCTQTITIENDNIFTINDINWPNNFISTGCDSIQALPNIAGEPVLSDDKCAQVASTYEDQVFYISGDACVKILREWTVIDWCQFDADNESGLWTYIQEIKLKNTVAPVILSCEDVEVCSYDEDCLSENVTISAMATDDCTDSLSLYFVWKLDIDDNGSIDEEGEGASFDRVLELGAHRVFWTVEDGCGNPTTCDYRIDVRDCKNPTPYCISSITTTIMPSAGEIDVWASDFDYGSTDNCTEEDNLVFSFSPNINDTNRVFNCDSLENGIAQIFSLEMWVTDEWGNQERCEVSFIVQDNDDVCADNGTIKGKISGKVITQDQKSIPDAEIDIAASIDTFSGFEMTDEEGLFVSESPEYLKYTLRPYYSSAASGGVSTFDLVLLQQHILGINEFDNPYDVIAGDVSKNERLNSSDLLIMRKMILGIILDWPKEQAPWTFVDSAYVFEDEEYPFYYPDSIVIQTLMDTTKAANFIAIKIGDINGSYNPSLVGDEPPIETRSDLDITSEFRYNVQSQSYDMSISSEEKVQGLQFSLTIPSGTTVDSDILSEDDYYILDNELRVVWLNDNKIDFDGTKLLSITMDKKENILLSSSIDHEVIVNNEAYMLPITIATDTEVDNKNIERLITILSNPFEDDLNIKVNTSDPIDIEVYNNNGQLIYSKKNIRNEYFEIPSYYFVSQGIYFVKIKYGSEETVEKVIRI